MKIPVNMTKQLLLSLFLAVFACDAAAQASRKLDNPIERTLRFGHLTPADGLSSEFIGAIIQDRQGFLWFGSESGLNRYDGYEIVVYRNDPDDPHRININFVSITALFEDHTGTLWGGGAEGLVRFDRDTNRFTSYVHAPDNPQSLSNNIVRVIAEDHDGTLWIGTKGGGLNRFERETGTFTHYQHAAQDSKSLSHDEVWALHVDREGTLWVGTSAGLDRFDRETETFTRYQYAADTPQSLGQGFVRALWETSDGSLWVGTDRSGLSRFNRNTEIFTHYQHDMADPHSLSDNAVFCLYEDRAGTLWVGTNNGLNRFEPDDETFTSYQHDPDNPDSLSDPVVQALWEDRAGTLWIGTFTGGVNKLDTQAQIFPHYRHQPNNPHSLRSNQVRGIFEDDRGYVWVGTVGGGLNRFDPETGQFTAYLPDPENPQSISTAVATWLDQDQNGALWVGTWGGGVCRFEPISERFTCYRYDAQDPRSLSSNLIVSVAVDHHNTVWVGTWGGGLNRFDRESGTFIRYQHDPDTPDSLGDNRILALFEDRAGTLWVGGNGAGLDRFEPETDTFTHYPTRISTSDGPNNLVVLDIYEDHAGAIWLGTTSGLYQFDRRAGNVHLYSEQEGMPIRIVRCIREDDAVPPNLWLSTNNGLYRFAPQTGSSRHYDIRDGLQAISFIHRSCEKSRTGELFFGGNNGFNRFDPVLLHDNSYIPPVVLTGFRVLNEPVGIGGDSPLQASITVAKQITLTADQLTFDIEFAALNYTIPSRNQYAYMLEGFDTDWTHTDSSRRFARYTNLDPGKYTFRVKGSNNDGIWNETGASVVITVLPAWWQTWWFRGTLLCSIVVLGYVGFHLRMRSIVAQNLRLEAQVKVRTTDLQESQRAMSTLLGNLPGMAYRCLNDKRWTMTFVSEGCYELTGYSAEDLLYNAELAYGDMIYSDDQKAVWDTVQASLQEKRSFQVLYRIVSKDGDLKWVWEKGQGVFSEEHRLLALEGFISDINEHKQAEEALRESERRYRVLVETAPYAIVVHVAGELVFLNSKAVQVFGGVSPEDLIGKSVMQFVHPDYHETVKYRLQMMHHEGDSVGTTEERFVRLDGTVIDVEVAGSLTQYMGQSANQVVFQDITQRKRAEEELRLAKQVAETALQSAENARQIAEEAQQRAEKAQQAAETANQSKNAFLANISHELRTPLNAILGYAQILQRAQIPNGNVQEGLHTIYESGEHLLTLINDILDLSKIEAGRIELHKKELSLLNFLDGIVRIVRMWAQEKGLDFHYEADPGLPDAIETDPVRLRQVLLNLLGNAVKFTERDGQVMFRVQRRHQNSSEDSITPPFHHSTILVLRFEIEDTGVGIAPEERDRIFLPFERAGEIGRRTEGTGLGLAIARQLMHLMGSDIQVESRIGRGSLFAFEAEFHVLEGLAATAPSFQQSAQRICGYTGKRLRILIVDDKPKNRQMLCDVLKPLGFKLQEAEDGQQAIENIESMPSDAILMDLFMPKMDGFEATRKIRQLAADGNQQAPAPDIPIIAISASVLSDDAQQIKEKGFDAFLLKPVDIDKLLTVLQEQLALEWEFETLTPGAAANEKDIPEGDILPPPPEDVRELYEIAELGMLMQVKERAVEIEGHDSRYAMFTRRVTYYSERCEDEELLRFLEQYC